MQYNYRISPWRNHWIPNNWTKMIPKEAEEWLKMRNNPSIHVLKIDDLFSIHLANGLASEALIPTAMEVDLISKEFLESSERFPCFRLNSVAKQSLSSATMSLIVGLLLEFGATQAIATSTVFQTEFFSYCPSNLGSTIFWISPCVTNEVTHCAICGVSPVLDITALQLIISNRAIPKLYTSLFSVSLFDT